jgi:hypothetical protein
MSLSLTKISLIPKRYEAERVLKAVSLISQGLQPVYYAHPHSRLV